LLIKENVVTQSILNVLVSVTLGTYKHQTQICTLYILEGTCWAKVYVGLCMLSCHFVHTATEGGHNLRRQQT